MSKTGIVNIRPKSAVARELQGIVLDPTRPLENENTECAESTTSGEMAPHQHHLQQFNHEWRAVVTRELSKIPS